MLHQVATRESKQMLMKNFEMDHFAILLKRHFLHVMLDQNKCILQQDLFTNDFKTEILFLGF